MSESTEKVLILADLKPILSSWVNKLTVIRTSEEHLSRKIKKTAQSEKNLLVLIKKACNYVHTVSS